MKFLAGLFLTSFLVQNARPELQIKPPANVKKVYIVSLIVNNEEFLVEVESVDKVNAVFDAAWPVTVWSKEDWLKYGLDKEFKPVKKVLVKN